MKKILVLLLVFVVGLPVGYYFLQHIGLKHELIVNKQSFAVPDGIHNLKRDLGLDALLTVSNLSTEEKPGLTQVAVYSDQSGVKEYFSSHPPGKRMTFTLFKREVKNLFGEMVLNYNVTGSYQKYGENEYLIDIDGLGGGHAGYSVKSELVGKSQQIFIIKIYENIFGDLKFFYIQVEFKNDKPLITYLKEQSGN